MNILALLRRVIFLVAVDIEYCKVLFFMHESHVVFFFACIPCFSSDMLYTFHTRARTTFNSYVYKVCLKLCSCV